MYCAGVERVELSREECRSCEEALAEKAASEPALPSISWQEQCSCHSSLIQKQQNHNSIKKQQLLDRSYPCCMWRHMADLPHEGHSASRDSSLLHHVLVVAWVSLSWLLVDALTLLPTEDAKF